MFGKNAIVRVTHLLTHRPHKSDDPLLKYVGMVGYIEETDAPGKRSLVLGINKDGNRQMLPIWLPWRCLEQEDAVEWRMAFIRHLAQARADKAKQAISQIAPDVVAAVNELRKFCDDSLRILYADKGLTYIVTVFVWPEIVETTLLALEAGARLPRGEIPEPTSEEVPNE